MQEPTAGERFLNGLLPENPTYRQMLGLCATLAVTNGVKPAFTMACSTGFVLICANAMISLMRKHLQPHLRILIFTLTIATFVTVVDRLLQAFFYPMSQQLGPYVPLIIVNCIIISRCEVCASKQSLPIAIADAVGQTLGFLIGLVSLASLRELLGNGTWCEFEILPQSWPRWRILMLPPGAFITFGLTLGFIEWFVHRKQRA